VQHGRYVCSPVLCGEPCGTCSALLRDLGEGIEDVSEGVYVGGSFKITILPVSN
jgi:hypothetical protein